MGAAAEIKDNKDVSQRGDGYQGNQIAKSVPMPESDRGDLSMGLFDEETNEVQKKRDNDRDCDCENFGGGKQVRLDDHLKAFAFRRKWSRLGLR
jgi:hypothetical protein